MAPKAGLDATTAELEIERAETGLRILLSLLFFVIARLVEAVLVVVVLFGLLFTLVTRREPSAQVRRFANHALSYFVTIVRYLTYNADTAPFPFETFPPELDLAAPAKKASPRRTDA